MGKKAKKIKDSAEVKVHKLEIEKLELQDKLKKRNPKNPPRYRNPHFAAVFYSSFPDGFSLKTVGA